MTSLIGLATIEKREADLIAEQLETQRKKQKTDEWEETVKQIGETTKLAVSKQFSPGAAAVPALLRSGDGNEDPPEKGVLLLLWSPVQASLLHGAHRYHVDFWCCRCRVLQ